MIWDRVGSASADSSCGRTKGVRNRGDARTRPARFLFFAADAVKLGSARGLRPCAAAKGDSEPKHNGPAGEGSLCRPEHCRATLRCKTTAQQCGVALRCNTATWHDDATRRCNTATWHCDATRRCNTATWHDDATRRCNTATWHDDATRRCNTATWHCDATRRCNTATWHCDATRRCNTATWHCGASERVLIGQLDHDGQVVMGL